MEHRITVCVDGKYGIQNLHFNIELGCPRWEEERKSLKEIRDDIMSQCLLAGYSSILHFVDIDGYKDAAIFLRLDSEAIADAFIYELDRIASCKKGLAESQNQDRTEFLDRLVRESELFFKHTARAYSLIGLDVNDTAKTRRILSNLGYERTSI